SATPATTTTHVTARRNSSHISGEWASAGPGRRAGSGSLAFRLPTGWPVGAEAALRDRGDVPLVAPGDALRPGLPVARLVTARGPRSGAGRSGSGGGTDPPGRCGSHLSTSAD